MTRIRLLPLVATLVLGGCDLSAMMGTACGPELVTNAEAQLKSGDLPGALEAYEAAAADNGECVDVAMGLAYMQLLSGQVEAADATLAAVDKEGIEPDVQAALRLRRALVALRDGDLDKVQQFGEKSGLPAGQVLAAEVYLADAESGDAIPLLEKASSAPGQVGQTAKRYLAMLQSDDSSEAPLAEATALWALGQRDVACESADELVRNLPEDYEGRDAALLLWAGRAVTSGKPDVAAGLLDEIVSPPEGQAWRVQATRALVFVATGEADAGVARFVALAEGGAPHDGLQDALATAAALAPDKETAKQLAAGLESNAAARGLLEAGAPVAAKKAAPTGIFKKYLEAR